MGSQQRRSLNTLFLGTTAGNLEDDDPGLVPIAGRRAYKVLSRTPHGIGARPESNDRHKVPTNHPTHYECTHSS